MMEEWKLDFEYLQIQHLIRERMERDNLPDLNAILFLIGIQELGNWKEKFSKEDKWNLMHIAVCKLLSSDGYYQFIGRDDEGWPHYELRRSIDMDEVKNQEILLKEKIVQYFKENNL